MRTNGASRKTIELVSDQYRAIQSILETVFEIVPSPGRQTENTSIYLTYRVKRGDSPNTIGDQYRKLFSQFTGVESDKCKRHGPIHIRATDDGYAVPIRIYSLEDFVRTLADYVEKNPISKCHSSVLEEIEGAFKTLFSNLPEIQRSTIKVPTKPGLWPEEKDAIWELLTSGGKFDCSFEYRKDSDPAVFDCRADVPMYQPPNMQVSTTPKLPELPKEWSDCILLESKERTITVKDKERFTLSMHAFFASNSDAGVVKALATCARNTEFNRLIALLIAIMNAPRPLARIIIECLFGGDAKYDVASTKRLRN